jgi:hypothetical protein
VLDSRGGGSNSIRQQQNTQLRRVGTKVGHSLDVSSRRLANDSEMTINSSRHHHVPSKLTLNEYDFNAHVISPRASQMNCLSTRNVPLKKNKIVIKEGGPYPLQVKQPSLNSYNKTQFEV